MDYYRLAAAAAVSEVGDGDTTREDGETEYGCVEFDAVGKDYILVKYLDTDTSDPIYSYMQFSYDDNDQFGTAGTGVSDQQDGTPATQAAWITAMAATCATGGAAAFPGGVVSSIAQVTYTNGLSTDITSHVLG